MGPLTLLLLRRETGRSGTGLLALLACVAALAGVAAARMTTFGPGAGHGRAAQVITRFDITAAIVFALIGAVRLTARPAEDHAGQWLHAFVGCGGSRRHYIGALFVAVVTAAVLAFTVAALVFGVAVFLAGGGADPVFRFPALWLTGALMIISFSAYGLAAGVLTREAGVALTAALIAFALPFAVAVPYVLITDAAGIPRWFRIIGFAHIPPLGLTAGPLLLLHHCAYIGAAILLARRLAPRVIGRWS